MGQNKSLSSSCNVNFHKIPLSICMVYIVLLVICHFLLIVAFIQFCEQLVFQIQISSEYKCSETLDSNKKT